MKTQLRFGKIKVLANSIHWLIRFVRLILHLQQRSMQIVQLLLEAGADPELADGDGVTPLAHARQRGYTGIETLLRQHGAVR